MKTSDSPPIPEGLPGSPAGGLSQALIDVVRAQRLLEAFYRRVASLLREVEVALRQADPPLQLMETAGYVVHSPTQLSLIQPEGWLRRWLAVFFAEPRFLGPAGVEDCSDLKLCYLLVNTDPAVVAEAELDLVLLSSCQGMTGALPGWVESIWNRGQFELTVPADGWYGRPERVDLGYGASLELQLHRVPLSRIPDREALQREVVDRLLERYRKI